MDKTYQRSIQEFLPEILLLIAAHLTTKAQFASLRVCRHWHLVSAPLIWQPMDDDAPF